MATKRKAPRRKAATRRSEPRPITVLHVCNALAQIESWIYYVREVLAHLDARMEIPVPPRDREGGVFRMLPPMKLGCPPASTQGPIRIFKIGCPPPVVVKPPQPILRIGCPVPLRRRRAGA